MVSAAFYPDWQRALQGIWARRPPAGLIRSWKTWTARQANALLGQTGTFWQREYHGRFIRDGDHLANVTRYMAENPVKAGLCARAEAWRWSSARWK